MLNRILTLINCVACCSCFRLHTGAAHSSERWWAVSSNHLWKNSSWGINNNNVRLGGKREGHHRWRWSMKQDGGISSQSCAWSSSMSTFRSQPSKLAPWRQTVKQPWSLLCFSTQCEKKSSLWLAYSFRLGSSKIFTSVHFSFISIASNHSKNHLKGLYKGRIKKNPFQKVLYF